MTSPLLKTKLNIPLTRAHLIPRPRLIARLDETRTHPLTIISAPPGFGKTTLVATWIEQQAVPAAWYALDKNDNDIAHFLAYLVAALDTVQAGLGRHALNRLHSRRMPPLESVMTLLINDIAAVPSDFVFVLDDYHLLELPAIHEAMSFLVDHIPPALHLLIITRADPPLPLTRLRARGQLVELRAPDLRFSPEEAAEFLEEGMGLRLTPEQVEALDARAEGWIAGLQLAALSMQGRGDIGAFVNAFAGSQRFILDYLADEVLLRQTEEVQTFLLQTSLLGQMNTSLANAVTGRNDSDQVLGRLEMANLFVVPLDEAGQWYRYHHLFGDFLQSRLLQSRAGEIPELHRRASEWYEHNGFVNESIEHSLAIPDFDLAARFVQQAGLALLIRSEFMTLLSWLARLPEDMIRQQPFLGLLHATALIMSGKIDLGSARLAKVDDSKLDPLARVMAALLRPMIPLLTAGAPQAVESAREALEVARQTLSETAGPQAELNAVIALYMGIVLAELEIAAGQLRAASDTCRSGLRLGEQLAADSQWAIILGFVHYELAGLLYEWNDIGAAGRHAAQGLEICRAGGNQELESYALVALAQIKQAEGNTEAAYALVHQAVQLEHKRNIPSEMRYIASRLVKVLLAQDRIEEAWRSVSELPPEDQVSWLLERWLGTAAQAQVLITQGQFARAAELLEHVLAPAEAASLSGSRIETLALLSLAKRGQGEQEQAMHTLLRALALAEPEGYVRTFVDLGEPMRDLLLQVKKVSHGDSHGSQVADSNALNKYLTKLLSSFPPRVEPSGSPTLVGSGRSQALPEPLSERELAVLRLIEAGLSNQEIADRLVVQLSTVKTHINNIYSKLNVGARTQALARAHELKIL